MGARFALLATALCAALLGRVAHAPAAQAQASSDLDCEAPRLRLSFNEDWRFYQGTLGGAYAPGYDDAGWRRLDLPHDWSIEGDYDQDRPAGAPGAFLPGGVGWYRKQFEWQSAWEDKQVEIVFDGVYMNSSVWVNGQYLGTHRYGYTGFSYDLTPYLEPGRNTIAVRVDNAQVPSGRWYTGSGIYRDVHLSVTEPVHVARHGTFVRTPQVSRERAAVAVRTEVRNGTKQPRSVRLQTRVLGENGEVVATQGAPAQSIAAGGVRAFEQTLEVEEPQLWSPESPDTYQVESRVYAGDTLADVYHTRTGFRSFTFTADRGFVLNGEPTELRGMSMHHDAGPVGTAVPTDVWHRRLKLLKDMGVNALRTTHYPFRPAFYAMADTMGFLVIDEAFDGWHEPKAEYDYGRFFAENWRADLHGFIRRDRNHPSVVIWSIGNEVRGHTPEQQAEIARFARALDPTRPITQGGGKNVEALDVVGFNGVGEMKGVLKEFHEKHPETPVVGTEMTHTLQTRGVYKTQTHYRTRDFPAPWERPDNLEHWKRIEEQVYKVPDLADEEVFTEASPHYRSSYDNAFVRMNVRQQLRFMERLDYLAGTFRWTAFDYLGESFGWPARTANFGILDLAGFEKDAYYLYQSQWTTEPMVHLLPHWTHPGKEGEEIPVVAYTNQECVELFLNGRSLGTRCMEGRNEAGRTKMQLVWQVPYEPGTLRAAAKSGGEPTATRHTAGDPAALELRIGRERMRANGRDVAHAVVRVVDSAGHPVPEADNRVRFNVEGPAQLIGTESGDVRDLTRPKSNARRVFKGKALALVQVGKTRGTVTVTAQSGALEDARATLPVRAGEGDGRACR